jgi:hypothetical protein
MLATMGAALMPLAVGVLIFLCLRDVGQGPRLGGVLARVLRGPSDHDRAFHPCSCPWSHWRARAALEG